MKLRARKVFVFFILAALSLSASAQKVPQDLQTVSDPDPFKIQRGSSFSASSPAAPAVRGNGDPAAYSRITSDLAEALELVKNNQVSGRRLSVPEMVKTSLTGMLHTLDPHSNFFDAAEWKDLLDEEKSGYSGIGATISNYEWGGQPATYVVATYPGSPAFRAQLRFGDKIVAINGRPMTGQSSDFVRDQIRGEEGTNLRVTIERGDNRRTETITLQRNRVPQPSIPDSYMIRPTIGYIELSEGFNYTTSAEFSEAFYKLKRQGMKSLVLDLRNNGGGIVEQAVKVAEKFLPAGSLILTQRGRTRLDNRVWKSSNTSPETLPLVVLVDENTASASEIVAGAFQDNDRALIIGDKTFGKGLVQSVIDLPGNTGLTLTCARYLTPSGRSIQRDYSSMDLYDYFSHKESNSSVGTPFFEARTLTDRKVFGGDGIQPDIPVKGKEPSEIAATLLDPIFFFARDVVNGRIPGGESYRRVAYTANKRASAGDFSVNDALAAEFYKYLQQNPIWKITPAKAKTELSFIKLRLRYNIMMASYGDVTATQVLIEDDPQVETAMESLPRSAQLANLASTKRSKINR